MIPRASITAWRGTVPWADDLQVEQDLVLSRALVEIFTEPALRNQVVLRGGTAFHKFAVDNPWFRGEAEVVLYQLAELLGTKLRALFQRKKGRDLFDLWLALEQGIVNPADVVECFEAYLRQAGLSLTRAQLEANLAVKISDPKFHQDVLPLLAAGVRYDPVVAFKLVLRELAARLPGDPWKGDDPRLAPR